MEIPAGFEFETERLRAERIDGGSADRALVAGAAAILSPAVTAFLPPALQVAPGETDAAAWLDAAAREARVLGVRTRAGELVGFVLLLAAGGGEIMLGYLLAERAWGQGYATELLRGLVAALPGRTLVGGVDPGNEASVAVLRRAGFRPRPGRAPGGSVYYAREPGRG